MYLLVPKTQVTLKNIQVSFQKQDSGKVVNQSRKSVPGTNQRRKIIRSYKQISTSASNLAGIHGKNSQSLFRIGENDLNLIKLLPGKYQKQIPFKKYLFICFEGLRWAFVAVYRLRLVVMIYSLRCGIFPDQRSNLCHLHWQVD